MPKKTKQSPKAAPKPVVKKSKKKQEPAVVESSAPENIDAPAVDAVPEAQTAAVPVAPAAQPAAVSVVPDHEKTEQPAMPPEPDSLEHQTAGTHHETISTPDTNSETSVPNNPPVQETAAKPVVPSTDDTTAPAASATTTHAPTGQTAKKPRRFRRMVLLGILILLVAGSTLAYRAQLAAPGLSSADAAFISDVAKVAVLPADETPAISTVVDPSRVDQPFLADARKGDKVLLFFQEGKAIVYRPSSRQIVSMGPLAEPNPRIFLRNGAPGTIPADFIEAVGGLNDFVLVSQDASTRRDYKESFVVDVAGNRPEIAKRVAEALKLEVRTLPDKESRPDADILIMVGSDAR